MDHFAGLDVSVKETSVCIVDDTGNSGAPEKNARDLFLAGNTVAASRWCFRCCLAAKDCVDRRNKPARWWR